MPSHYLHVVGACPPLEHDSRSVTGDLNPGFKVSAKDIPKIGDFRDPQPRVLSKLDYLGISASRNKPI